MYGYRWEWGKPKVIPLANRPPNTYSTSSGSNRFVVQNCRDFSPEKGENKNWRWAMELLDGFVYRKAWLQVRTFSCFFIREFFNGNKLADWWLNQLGFTSEQLQKLESSHTLAILFFKKKKKEIIFHFHNNSSNHKNSHD